MLSWFFHYCMPKDERARETEESVSMDGWMWFYVSYESAFRNLEKLSKQLNGQSTYHIHDNKLF